MVALSDDKRPSASLAGSVCRNDCLARLPIGENAPAAERRPVQSLSGLGGGIRGGFAGINFDTPCVSVSSQPNVK